VSAARSGSLTPRFHLQIEGQLRFPKLRLQFASLFNFFFQVQIFKSYNKRPKLHTMSENELLNLPPPNSNSNVNSTPTKQKSHAVSFSFASPRRGALADKSATTTPITNAIYISDIVFIKSGTYANTKGVVKSITEKTCRVLINGKLSGNIPKGSLSIYDEKKHGPRVDKKESLRTPSKKLKTSEDGMSLLSSPTPRKRRREGEGEGEGDDKEGGATLAPPPPIELTAADIEREVEKLQNKLTKITIKTPAKRIIPPAPVCATSSSSTATDMRATAEILQQIENNIPIVPVSIIINNKLNPQVTEKISGWRTKYQNRPPPPRRGLPRGGGGA